MRPPPGRYRLAGTGRRRHYLGILGGGLLGAPLLAAVGGCLPGFDRHDAWRVVVEAPVARFEAQGAVAGGRLYLLGGFYNSRMDAAVRVDVFDPLANRWTRLADMPEPVTHAPVVADGDTLYVLGGYVGEHPGGSTAHVWKYGIGADRWEAGPALPVERGAGAATIAGRSLHFFGGTNRLAGKTDDVDQPDHFVLSLDGGGNTGWQRRSPLPNPRNHLAGLAIGDQVYALGGQRGSAEGTQAQAEVDVYDSAADAWRRVADLPLACGHITSSTFPMNGRIVIVGGSVNDGGCCGLPTGQVAVYEPTGDIWVLLPSLPAPRKSPVAGLAGDRIVVSTGNPGSTSPTFATWSLTLAGTWERGAPLPVPLGEVAGGIVGRRLFLVGEGHPATLAYDFSTGAWADADAISRRPSPGNHHAAEVVDGRLYLLGGLSGSEGKVQIYDPPTNTWRYGADPPFAAGSCASAVIGGEIYLAGGIVGEVTTSGVARYDPRRDAWTRLAPLPDGRNHAAGATDGTRFYVFGGRGAGSGDGNVVANGFAGVQVYDPTIDRWTASADPGAAPAPLPQARGGMGRAVFHDRRFYVLGGETQNGQGARRGGVYDRVDVYDPQTNTWRLGSPMPTARHGICPVAIAGRIYVAGGGVRAGASTCDVLEVYNPA